MQYLGENLEVGMNVNYGSCGHEWETTIKEIKWSDKDEVYYLECLDTSDYESTTTIQLTKENVAEMDEYLSADDYEGGYCYEYSTEGFGRTIVNLIPQC